jgi:hypothetical protein
VTELEKAKEEGYKLVKINKVWHFPSTPMIHLRSISIFSEKSSKR